MNRWHSTAKEDHQASFRIYGRYVLKGSKICHITLNLSIWVQVVDMVISELIGRQSYTQRFG